MKTSSRNAYPGKITAIVPGNLSDEVEISLETGEKIYSQILIFHLKKLLDGNLSILQNILIIKL